MKPPGQATGAQALARALADGGVRAAYSFPGAPATQVSLALVAEKRVRHAYATNEAVAATLALAGATLDDWPTACVLKHVGTNVALDALATAAQMNEYRSACVFIEGIDAAPRTSQNVQDNRPLWADHARMVALEPGTPQECYDLCRYALALSARTGMPVVVRAEERVLGATGPLEPRPAAPEPAGPPRWAQPAPFVSTAATCGYHSARRARLLAEIELCCARTPGAGRHGFVVAGQLGAVAAAGAPTLRLGGSSPLPAGAIRGFAIGLENITVVEEGLPRLTEAVRALGLGIPVERGTLAAKVPSAPLGPPALPEARLVPDAPDWASFFAEARGRMSGFAESDPRRSLFQKLRALGRPALVATDPGVTGVLGIPQGLVDLKLQMGCAAPAAGAFADAGVDALAVAVLGDTNFYHSELLGVLDNAIAGRDVLHVVCINRKSEMTAGVRTPYLGDAALEAMLRGAGLAVFADLDAAAAAQGPRVLLFRTETSVEADA